MVLQEHCASNILDLIALRDSTSVSAKRNYFHLSAHSVAMISQF